ncbi:MAG TPA: flagellar export chaperone FliS [Steroidobacteraceae bacterium]|nr:flagellar export chaperone FliS [Steroidobacteraceae bacterium]
MPAAAPSRTCAFDSSVARLGPAAAHSNGFAPMLMESALEHIAQARRQLHSGEGSERRELLHGAVQLLETLRNSLDLHRGDAYAVNLDDLCDYLSRQLAAASLHDRVATLDEVSHLLREIRCAWPMYV